MNDTIQPERMPLTSPDIVEEKRHQLRQCLAASFPEIMAEENIDFDQLRRVLGEWVEPDRERFGLNWPGKAACMKVIQAPSVGTLKPCPEESVDWDTTENVFIEGDNLEVLKLLQKAYFGKIKMIYIDPPYNTGKEFIYPDKYSETLDTYLEYTGQKDSEGRKFSTNTDSSGRFHSRWLNMMYPRLYLAKNLLREDGVIFASIDDNEAQENLRALMNEVFGEENFLANICVLSNPRGRQSELIATSHEYIVTFARSIENVDISGQALNSGQLADYKFETRDGRKYRLRGLRHRGNESRRVDRPDMYFPIYVNPETRQASLEESSEFRIPVVPKKSTGEDGRWEWGPKTAQMRLDRLEAVFVQGRGEWDIHQREFLQQEDSEEDRTTKWKTMWIEKEVNYQNGKTELKTLFGECPVDYPKPVALLVKLIAGSTSDGDVVLDFFAGSATTAHACFEANNQDGKNRQFIMVQLPEPSGREDLKSIAAIARQRIRLAASAIENQSQNDMLATTERGFRSFRLDNSNFRTWDGAAADEAQLGDQLTLHVDHVSAESSIEDILYELLLKDGFQLSTQIAKLQIAGKEVFSIAEGALLICLDKQLTQEVIDALADMEPSRVICLDAGFQGNDQLKANAVQTFKARARNRETAIEFRTV